MFLLLPPWWSFLNLHRSSLLLSKIRGLALWFYCAPVIALCCRLLPGMHTFSPFALGCCFFRLGSSRLDHSERREVGGVLWLRVGATLAWPSDPTVLGKCWTRCSVSFYHHCSPLPFSKDPTWFSFCAINFCWPLGPARLRGWRQCCLNFIIEWLCSPMGLRKGSMVRHTFRTLLVSVLCHIWIILHGGFEPNS